MAVTLGEARPCLPIEIGRCLRRKVRVSLRYPTASEISNTNGTERRISSSSSPSAKRTYNKGGTNFRYVEYLPRAPGSESDLQYARQSLKERAHLPSPPHTVGTLQIHTRSLVRETGWKGRKPSHPLGSGSCNGRSGLGSNVLALGYRRPGPGRIGRSLPWWHGQALVRPEV